MYLVANCYVYQISVNFHYLYLLWFCILYSKWMFILWSLVVMPCNLVWMCTKVLGEHTAYISGYCYEGGRSRVLWPQGSLICGTRSHCLGNYILYDSAWYLWVLHTKLTSCHTCDAKNFEMVARFSEKFVHFCPESLVRICQRPYSIISYKSYNCNTYCLPTEFSGMVIVSTLTLCVTGSVFGSWLLTNYPDLFLSF
jgi:hypothetical protein